jgi:Carboxypeptidase regulatory-like domain
LHPRSSLAPIAMRPDASARLGLLAAFVLALLSFPLPSTVFAQTTNGSLNGRVTDPSKAAIVDANVVAIRVETNVRYETATNATGGYFLMNLSPGVYRIEVEKAGFSKIGKPDVIVHVHDALTVDFELRLGPLTDTVTVEAGMVASARPSRSADRARFSWR